MFVLFALVALPAIAPGQSQTPAPVQPPVTYIKIDGARKFQTFDGIGINANTRSWNGKELEPALDLLLDSMHAKIWRVLVETVEKWEDVNDNSDPFTFNWKYYNALYETPKFQKVWGMVKYLNDRGIRENLMFNFMGFAPEWMGVKVIAPQYEDEYVEMIVSFFYYALKTKNLRFGLIGPTNETEHHCCKEGPHLNGEQHARILRKLIDRMEALKIMNGIKIVAPDNANTEIAIKDYLPAMMKDPVIMSHVAHLGVHSYGGYHKGFTDFVQRSAYPNSSWWVTEWNAWCQGCDEGILGEYNYAFAGKAVNHLLDLLQHGAQAALAWEGYDSYYEHHAPSPFSYWGMLAYKPEPKSYIPRPNFYAIQQVSRFVPTGSRRIFTTDLGDSIRTVAYYDSATRRITLVGVNTTRRMLSADVMLSNLAAPDQVDMYITDETRRVSKVNTVRVNGKSFRITVPPAAIFTITGMASVGRTAVGVNAKPADWYSGDIHVHRNCGDERVLPESELPSMMEENDLDVISLLADMGNGEVLNAPEDLKKVNGKLAPQSKGIRLIQWDTEWHFDATYSKFEHQALGGHLVLLGLKEAHQIWEESPYKILEWARKQGAVTGFCHFQYLNDQVQNELNCCIPVDYPVEAALGTIDFVSEDVFGVGSPGAGWFNSEAAMHAYYRLLNCGFRLGLAAGTDYPCNENEPLGTLLTYVKVKEQPLTYRAWVDGIRAGRTVVSRRGNAEFLDLQVNSQFGPGDVIALRKSGYVELDVAWSSTEQTPGVIEIVRNGVVVSRREAIVQPGVPAQMKASVGFDKSGWLCARRMDETGHVTHTAPVYVSVSNKPVRASAEDARYFVSWIDNILKNTEPGGPWARYFTKDQQTVRDRYIKARNIYDKISKEAGAK
ncbi:CehA/McbA family metallohydrolase [Chryseolinea sp. T2]|uniref:CehA/McbA family metallohydrolase n=1 Tax=Chryseolinea sp. T2 TaxID=3129255 RepID=UPI003077A5D1